MKNILLKYFFLKIILMEKKSSNNTKLITNHGSALWKMNSDIQ